MNKKKTIITTTILLLLGSIIYYLNKHIVTVTDYSKGGIKETIFVFDLSKVKKIPNYENYAKDTEDDGMELVFEKDYERYHQGYCLKENRILSDEEIFRRGIIDDLKKRLLLEKKICHYEDNCREPVEYYILSDINSTNWYEKFIENNDKTKLIRLKDTLLKTSKVITVNDIAKYLTIDMSNMLAKLNVVIIDSNGEGDYALMTDKFYFLHKADKFRSISIFSLVLLRNCKVTRDDIIEYKEKLKKINGNYLLKGHKIDNCGNIYLNFEKQVRLLTQGG